MRKKHLSVVQWVVLCCEDDVVMQPHPSKRTKYKLGDETRLAAFSTQPICMPHSIIDQTIEATLSGTSPASSSAASDFHKFHRSIVKIALVQTAAMASTSVSLSSHACLASSRGDLYVLRTSKSTQARGGWRGAAAVRAMSSEGVEGPSRREVTVAAVLTSLSLAATTVGFGEDAQAVSSSRRALRSELVPESDYKTLPNGLKYYDVKVGGGKAAERGSRVAVHYVAKWKGLTFMTSRQGMGVTGGTPYGFDIGASEYGIVLKGLDYGVEGMRVGGQRLLIVPPELAYGNKGVQEIPPNATLQFDVELLSIKQDNSGSRVKVVEG